MNIHEPSIFRHLPIHLSTVFVCLFVFLTVWLPVCLCLCVYLSLCVSIDNYLIYNNPHCHFQQRMGDLEFIFCHSFSAHMAVFWLNPLFPRHVHFLENWVFALKMMVQQILGILGECLEGWVCFSRCMPTHFLERAGLIIQKGYQ